MLVKEASPPFANCAIGKKWVVPSVLELLTASKKAGAPCPSEADVIALLAVDTRVKPRVVHGQKVQGEEEGLGFEGV